MAAAVGKVFFTLGGEDYVCSGTLVGGKHPDVVLTAAHCVTGGPGRAAARAVGDELDVRARLRRRAAALRRVHGAPVLRQQGLDRVTGGREQYDVAFVQVTTATLPGVSGPWLPGTAEPPPGLPVKFAGRQDAAPLSRTYVFGYPAELPYSGLYLDYCAGPVVASGGSVRTPCGMTAGDSGGPWLAGFSPRSGSGQVVAVSTYKVSGSPRALYGAVLGPQARALYERAVSRAR